MDLLLIYGLCFGAAGLVGVASYPPLATRITSHLQTRATQATSQLGEMFMEMPQRTILWAYAVSCQYCYLEIFHFLLYTSIFKFPALVFSKAAISSRKLTK